MLWAFASLWFANILFHLPSFSRQSFYGDERVFLALAREMRWDASNFSTAGVAEFKDWPNTIYRNPVYHQGPVLPYVMKLGAFFGRPEKAAFVFAALCFALYFVQAFRLSTMMGVPAWAQVFGFALVATEPILVFSTTRLHNDGTGGLLLAAGIIAYWDASRSRSVGKAVFGGLLLCIAMNLRATAILAIPIVCTMHAYAMVRRGGSESLPPAWREFAIVLAMLATLGLWHTWRLLLTYGTLDPAVFMAADPESAWYRMLAQRTPGIMALNLVLLVPALLLLATPAAIRAWFEAWRRGSPAAVLVASSLFLFVALFVMDHRELRFFSLATPLFFASLPALLARGVDSPRGGIIAFGILAVIANVCVIAMYVLVRRDQGAWIIPALYEFVPALLPLYGPSGM